jgi:hypothetical protein
MGGRSCLAGRVADPLHGATSNVQAAWKGVDAP